ncbi:MAG: TetR/AcrR family transcriptional regulator [Lachnospiraceae bacterium]|nr:TetR/AcrR family transcriptional regulator [Lachnospiraceae bacterium]
MPPKVKITKDMIIDAAFSIAKTEGADKITARNISERLNCSTQPVLYHFSSIEEIKKTVYKKADEYHSNYIMDVSHDHEDPFLAIGINYIQFAMEESHLFQFLFQSNEFSGSSIIELTDSEDLMPIISVFQKETDVSTHEAKEIFRTIFIFIHGYASLHANNKMVYDEKALISTLTKVFYGAVYAAKQEVQDEENL